MGPFHGIRVIDITQFLAGPLAAQLLGDMGADVIKIERPGTGDAARTGSASPYSVNGERIAFLSANRNKRSVTLDLKSDAGVEAARRLIERADVLVENFRPGVMERLGLGYDTLKEANPGLIYCSITGYGSKGPKVNDPGQDLLVQGFTGFARLNGRRGDPPVPAGPPIVDAACGYAAALAIAAALFERARTGKGRRVEVSLMSVALALQLQEVTTFLNCGVEPERSEAGIAHPNFIAPYGVYETADGYISLAHNALPKLGELLAIPELAEVKGVGEAFRRRDEVYRLLADRLCTRSTSEWMELMNGHGMWAAPVQNYEQFFADEHVKGAGLVAEVEHPVAGTLKLLAPPFTFGDEVDYCRLAPPVLGAHTAEVLRELGCGDEEIARAQGGEPVGTPA